MDADTRRLLEFLSAATSYPHRPANVRMLQTHASWVFIAPPFVCKVKKPVDFGFLNFTTLERRRQNCETEVRLNRRLAPDVYLSTLPIRKNDGELTFAETGEIVEWAVWMKEMDASTFLSHRLREGRCTVEHVEGIGKTLCAFYRSVPPIPASAAIEATHRLRRFVHENFPAIRQFADIVPQHMLEAIETFCNAFEQSHANLLERRAVDGWVRDGHGDLHSEHISVADNGLIQIFDCLEFNDDLRLTDIACDLAFLAMDLDFNGRHDFSTELVRVSSRTLEDASLDTVIPYYQSYRACVRGKVELLHSVAETASETERHQAQITSLRYLRLALRYALVGTERCIVAFMGGVASGKSFLAEQLSRLTGWNVLSSDRIRKTLAGVELHYRGTENERSQLYQPAMSELVYHRQREEALSELSRSSCVILDATFSRRTDRSALQAFCNDQKIELLWVEAFAPESIIRERLALRSQRSDVISDARAEDYESLAARYEAPSELPTNRLIQISTDGQYDLVFSNLLTELAIRCGRQFDVRDAP